MPCLLLCTIRQGSRTNTVVIPSTILTTVSTFTYRTDKLTSHTNAIVASGNLQRNVNKIQIWQRKWKIEVHERKSTHTFGLNSVVCLSITLNDNPTITSRCDLYRQKIDMMTTHIQEEATLYQI